MFLEDNESEFLYSQLAQFKVYDKNGHSLGKPGNALLSVKDLKINSLILFSGFLEEKMEDLKLKENIDPIVPVSAIESIDAANKKITLKVAKNELKTTDNNYIAPEGTIQYLKLKKLGIYEKNNEHIGRVIDIFFKPDGKYSLIVGGSHLEEFLENMRIIPDKDLIVPGKSVTQISDKIIINLSKIDLITTLNDPNFNPQDAFKYDKYGFVTKDPAIYRDFMLHRY